MASNLQEKPAVAPFVQQAAWARALYRQAAEDEGPRGESEGLVCGFPLFPNELDYLGAAKLLLRYDEVRMGGAEDGSSWFQTFAAECS
jgi:hypothetical protein